MRNIILEWKKSVLRIRNQKEIDSDFIYYSLIEWVKLVSLAKNDNIKELYNSHLKYFDQINFYDYKFRNKWYSIEEIVKYDLSRDKWNINSAILTCSIILLEIIIFKSNRSCKLLEEDDLRVFQDIEGNKIYFICDGCGYAEDINGKFINIDLIRKLKLIPAKENIVTKFKIKPSVP